MANKDTLRQKLRPYCPNVYISQPSKLDYPCIIIGEPDLNSAHANNNKYITYGNFMLTIIVQEETNTLVETIFKNFNNISFDRSYVTNKLIHTILICNEYI